MLVPIDPRLQPLAPFAHADIRSWDTHSSKNPQFRFLIILSTNRGVAIPEVEVGSSHSDAAPLYVETLKFHNEALRGPISAKRDPNIDRQLCSDHD